MSITRFADIASLSTTDITKEIIAIENQLFDLRFRKAMRQSFKSHEIKCARRNLAQLKTLLTLRSKNLGLKKKS